MSEFFCYFIFLSYAATGANLFCFGEIFFQYRS